MTGLFRKAIGAMGIALAACGSLIGLRKQAPSGQYSAPEKQRRMMKVGDGRGNGSRGTNNGPHAQKMAAKRLVRRRMAKKSRKVNYALCKMRGR